MTLAEYVQKIMDEQRLKAADVERRSGNQITDSHVKNIVNGVTTNPSLKAMLGLAEGLGVDPVEVFKAAAGIQEDLSAYQMVRVMQGLLSKPNKLKSIKKTLELE